MKKLFLKYYVFLPLLLLCTFYISKAIHFEIHDFANYYFGGYFLGQNHFTSNIYFPYFFNQKIVALGNQPLFAGFAPNSPFLALLFYPFTFLSLATAKLLFNCISVVLFIFSLSRFISFYKIKPIYVALIPVLFLVPIKNDLLFGQVYLLLFFLLSESWLAYEKKQFVRTSIFLSLAILLKVFPLLLVFIFLFRKEFRPFFYTLISGLLLISITLFFCGFDVWVFYVKDVLIRASDGQIASAYESNYQSVYMFLKEFLVFDATQNPNSFFNLPVLFSALIIAFKIGLIAIGWLISKKSTNSLFIFSYWILAMILISPYGSTYTFILLLFPFFALLKSEISNLKKTLFFVLLFLINNFLLRYFISNPFPFSYLRLFVLIVLFILFVTIIYKTVNWKIIMTLSVILVIGLLFLKKKEPQMPSLFLGKNSPLLIYDYEFRDNQFSYFYWNQNGKNEQKTNLTLKSIVPLEIKNNQVFYLDRQLTFDSSNKMKPFLLNGKMVMYLSDYGRGIGFYTPLTIELK